MCSSHGSTKESLSFYSNRTIFFWIKLIWSNMSSIIATEKIGVFCII